MSKSNKVNWFKSANNLSEIYQSVNMKYSFASKKDNAFTQCHKWVKCRDFLHDAVRTALTGNKSNIFGFSFEKGVNPDINLDGMTMLVSQKGLKTEEELLPSLQKSLKIINHYESIAKKPLSKLTKVDGDKNSKYSHVWVIEGPKLWMTTPYLVSMFTFLLRLGCKDVEFKDGKTLKEALKKASTGKNEKDNDAKYLTSVWDKLEILVANHSKIMEEEKDGYSNLYFQDTPIGTFHDRSGIVSTCKGNAWSAELNKKIAKTLKESK